MSLYFQKAGDFVSILNDKHVITVRTMLIIQIAKGNFVDRRNTCVDHVLVIRREGVRKVVRMLRFTGTCPLCGGEVEIQEGRRSLRGRYVGECGRNPLEHVFTFDHVLKTGYRVLW